MGQREQISMIFQPIKRNCVFGKTHFQMSSAKCRPLYSEPNVLNHAISKSFRPGGAYLRHWPGFSWINTLRPKQHGRNFTDDTFKRIFLNENVIISIKISLKFPKGPINNIPALVQIMALRRPGDKPLSEAMMVSLITHICVTRPQWVKILACLLFGTKPLSESMLVCY